MTSGWRQRRKRVAWPLRLRSEAITAGIVRRTRLVRCPDGLWARSEYRAEDGGQIERLATDQLGESRVDDGEFLVAARGEDAEHHVDRLDRHSVPHQLLPELLVRHSCPGERASRQLARQGSDVVVGVGPSPGERRGRSIEPAFIGENPRRDLGEVGAIVQLTGPSVGSTI